MCIRDRCKAGLLWCPLSQQNRKVYGHRFQHLTRPAAEESFVNRHNSSTVVICSSCELRTENCYKQTRRTELSKVREELWKITDGNDKERGQRERLEQKQKKDQSDWVRMSNIETVH